MSLLNFVPLLQATGQSQQGNFLFSFAPLLFMIVIFYFLLIRPQQKKQKEHKNMLSQIKKGDRVLTNGGILGLIERVKDDGNLIIKVADNVKIEFAKSSVASLIKGSGQEQVVVAKK